MSLLAASFYITAATATMRASPSDDSMVVSEALFSEPIQINSSMDGWVNITTPDGYQGWIDKEKLSSLEQPLEPNAKISRLKAHLYRAQDIQYGPALSLPYGVSLLTLDEGDPRWVKVFLPDKRELYIQRGDIKADLKLNNKSDLPPFSERFLALPYTWGGRSSFGYDCSGFVQMLYQQIGIDLPRDAKDQILDNRFKTIALEDLTPGDLIFFGNALQKINHVGLYLGDHLFIHATAKENKPWIRISSLSDFEWSGNKENPYPFRFARQLK